MSFDILFVLGAQSGGFPRHHIAGPRRSHECREPSGHRCCKPHLPRLHGPYSFVRMHVKLDCRCFRTPLFRWPSEGVSCTHWSSYRTRNESTAGARRALIRTWAVATWHSDSKRHMAKSKNTSAPLTQAVLDGFCPRLSYLAWSRCSQYDPWITQQHVHREPAGVYPMRLNPLNEPWRCAPCDGRQTIGVPQASPK